jgi:Uma2 family endonuclease
MATASTTTVLRSVDYPTSDGKPMAETDWHRDLMVHVIDTLKDFFAAVRKVYVSGNLLIFYVPGNKRKHVAPDVFVVKGVPKHDRPYYLVWEEGKGPSMIIELTSSSTRRTDQTGKFQLYRDVLKVKEYFLFDPLGDYLKPQLKGYRLRAGKYVPIRPVAGRLPSQVLGLHLEAHDRELRFYDPATGCWVPMPAERLAEAEAAQQQAETQLQQAETQLQQAETLRQQEAEARQQAETLRQQEAEARQQAETLRQQAEAELEGLRRQVAELRQRLPEPS